MDRKSVFAERLRQLCAQRDSISRVARDLDINRQQFARYLNGSTLPREPVLDRIAAYFDVPVAGLFATDAPASVPADAASVLSHSFTEVMRTLEVEQVTDRDLPDGLYMQYRQSFTKPGMVLSNLLRVYRGVDGEKRTKRVSSAKARHVLPGMRPGAKTIGSVQKIYGTLLLFEVHGSMGDLVVSALKIAAQYNQDLKPGVMLTQGRPGGFGPMAGRLALARLSGTGSVFAHARRQGFHRLDELPREIQALFQPPVHFPPAEVISVA